MICVSEGIVDLEGHILGSKVASQDPAGNIQYNGAAEAVKRLLVEKIGDAYFTRQRRNESADAAIFVRKIGHTQRGGRPILFDRFYGAQLGGKAVELLLEATTIAWPPCSSRDGGFVLDSMDANKLRDRMGRDPCPAAPAGVLRPPAVPALGPRASSISRSHLQPTPWGSTTWSASARIFDTGHLIAPLRFGERPRQQADPAALPAEA